MNRTLALVLAVGTGLTTASAIAQAPAAATPAAPAAAVPPPPQAVPAKIALIAFEQGVFATNEGQRAVADIQKKYEPRKSQIDALSGEVDSLKKQLQSAPATLSDDERATRLKTIDTKEKQLTRDAEDAQNAYNADLQDAYGKIAQKFSAAVKNYVSQNGYTILLDVSNQQTSNVMWINPSTNIDVTQAVVSAYNASSGVAAPSPGSSAARPRPSTTTTPRPATTTPHPAATAPKQ
jgi:Skp family chaperone for outer membrane proteins